MTSESPTNSMHESNGCRVGRHFGVSPTEQFRRALGSRQKEVEGGERRVEAKQGDRNGLFRPGSTEDP